MRSGTFPGASKMNAVIHHAPGDIKNRLWTLYWLARLLTSAPDGKQVVVELGVRNGDCTRAILCGLEDADNGATLWSFDIAENIDSTVRQHTAQMGIPWPLVNWVPWTRDSAFAGKDWSGGLVDFVFIDTDHTLETTRAELAAWGQHVRPGGLIALHDYWLYDPPRDKDEGRGVKIAVDEFFGQHQGKWNLECHDAAGDGDTGFGLLWRLK